MSSEEAHLRSRLAVPRDEPSYGLGSLHSDDESELSSEGSFGEYDDYSELEGSLPC